ncbi:MAG: 50S ribosomal protein L21 [Bacteroidetes bacterium]|jgi:large subunit ribosomal protein L21|nr:50S ribosomal protein L21 [Bacteroidota bacterium]
MYAIVEIAGMQYKVEKDQKIYTNRLEGAQGDELTFDKVLLLDRDGEVQIGSPSVSGSSVKATILGHVKGDKLIVFKKKRRKGYEKKNGHRQALTQLEIKEIA